MNNQTDIICFSHLRWDFVFQRPNHLMERCARNRRVFFVEEPMFTEEVPSAHVSILTPNLFRIVPQINRDSNAEEEVTNILRHIMRGFSIQNYTLWFYTPMALPWTRDLRPKCVVYDCMDELSAFKGASPELRALEAELLKNADIVFTGGQSLFDAKNAHHHNIHMFASSVDTTHFSKARHPLPDPSDQAAIGRPRLGFFGVIDERMDLDLIQKVALQRPYWNLIMVGPVVKIDPDSLPKAPNIHYLGQKSYQDLPSYVANWDVALMPFALNESTRFISPTKTLEYLAAGKPVVSTAIADVVVPYGERGFVHVGNHSTFIQCITRALEGTSSHQKSAIDTFLASTSWDHTWAQMNDLLTHAIAKRSASSRQIISGRASSRFRNVEKDTAYV